MRRIYRAISDNYDNHITGLFTYDNHTTGLFTYDNHIIGLFTYDNHITISKFFYMLLLGTEHQ